MQTMKRRRLLFGMASAGALDGLKVLPVMAVEAEACKQVPLGGLTSGSVSLTSSESSQRVGEQPVKASDLKFSVFALGTPPWRTFDPFLFCVHHKDDFPAGNEAMGPATPLTGRNLGQDFAGKDGWNMYHGEKIPGFPRHPHRGFETVTVTRRGFVDHSDSLGATARYGEGDVQWMTAGAGIAHAEMFPLLSQETDNPAELFQIWLNLPRKDKMVAPHFSMFWHEKVPKHTFSGTQQAGTVELVQVAGHFGETQSLPPPPSSWASSKEAELAIWSFKLSSGAKWSLPEVSPGTVRTLYFFRGEKLQVAGQDIRVGHGIRVDGSSEVPLMNGDVEAEVLLLQAKPLEEPVVQYGPFVMNTQDEIRQAYSDYQKTQFGPWSFSGDAPVHPRAAGRFARHADGRVEKA
jgi:redox-sensitive bicupin YhaK (pirin superfamily)